MVLGVITPDFTKRSTSTSQQSRTPSTHHPDAENLGSPSKVRDDIGAEKLVIPKYRNFSKPFGVGIGGGGRCSTSESLPASSSRINSMHDGTARGAQENSASALPEDQDQNTIRRIDSSRRSQSCSLPQSQSHQSRAQSKNRQSPDYSDNENEGDENEAVRVRSTSLGETIKEKMKVDDRARTWGGVPSTEMTVSGRTFWRSVLGSSARVWGRGG